MSQPSGPVADFEQPLASFETVDGLVAEVGKACDRPVNVLQITALLESAGVTDAIARTRYDERDVFVLAERVAERMSELKALDAVAQAEEPAPTDGWAAILLDYIRGPLGMVPLLLLSLMIHIYQDYGDWGNAQILTLSAATIGSLLVTSGFVQVAARKGSSYLSQGYIRAAERFMARILIAGAALIVTSAVALALGARWLGLLNTADQLLLVVAYITLSLLWLLSATLSLLQQVHWFGIGLGVGVGITYLSLRGLTALSLDSRWVMLIAGTSGIAATAALLLLRIFRTLRRKAAEAPFSQHRVVFAPLPQMVTNLAPYFGYGITYVLMILAGHIGGWIGHVPSGMNRIEAVATSETGLTVALGGYILASGVAERTMRRFWDRVSVYLRATRADTPDAFSHLLQQFRRAERRDFLVALLISTLLVIAWVAALALWITPGRLLGIPWKDAILVVLLAGLVGYAFLAMGVFESMFIITLSRPRLALEALVAGTLATLVAGVVAGIWLGYAYGALGIVFGSFIYFTMVRRRVDHMLSHAGYFYYSSF